MSNDHKSANMNDRGGPGKNEVNRGNDTTQKTGQQSQGGSQKDIGGTKQSGSRHAADQKQPSDQEHKGGPSE